MSERVQVAFNGRPHPAVNVLPGFGSGMFEFPLVDGGIMHVAINVFAVHRLIDAENPDGTPIYAYRTQTLIDILPGTLEPLFPEQGNQQDRTVCDA